jgi:hypothetical protein
MFGFLRVLHSKWSENAIMTKNLFKNPYTDINKTQNFMLISNLLTPTYKNYT